MSGYTKGPWQCYADLPSVEPNWHHITNSTRMRVVANVHIEPGNIVDEANARLLTASPEVFESLKDILPILEAVKYTVGLRGNQLTRMEKARAVIAKVERSPTDGADSRSPKVRTHKSPEEKQ